MTTIHAYAAEITKSERDEHGDLIVYGRATGPQLDLDHQIADPTWLKSAMPAWMEYGNLREMHKPIVAGVGLELEQQGDDWMVKSKVLDQGTALKIEHGALRGYSIGVKNPKVVKDAGAPGGRIVGGDIIEVSYVDRPCNPECTIEIAKAVGTDDVLAPVEAEPDDSPITAANVQKAIQEELRRLGNDARQQFLNPDRGDRAPASDWREQAITLVKAVGPDGTIDEAPDIAGGREAIALIARLIKAEADELAAGELDESCDISMLVSAVECLKCWLAREEGAAEEPDGVTYVGLSAEPDITKTADEPPVEDTPKTTEPDNSPALKDTIHQYVEAAVAKAIQTSEERYKALEAELAKVKATPLPGGPVVTTVRHTPQAPDGTDKAAYYERMADAVTDPIAKQGYRAKAAELRQRTTTH